MITFNLALGVIFSFGKRRFYVSGRGKNTIEIKEVGKENVYEYKKEDIEMQPLIYFGLNKL